MSIGSDYPYDADVLDEVARLLYAALPAMYRVPDEPPAGRGELQRLIEVLAAPLAVVRQNIQELHADLFIDTADDRMIPYLADMVGTRLLFPDARSNRRDVRGTVNWRRRKGTPAALEDMGSELIGQPVVLQEGWKRIQLAQDLNLVRGERVVPDLRPAIISEQAAGPLDALFHTPDVRRITATTGRRHPLHVAHWLHSTVTFPLREATPVDRTVDGSDVRYAANPLGARTALRARRIAGDRTPFIDRIPEQHFAATPQRWFGQTGGFTVRVCGLPAAIAMPQSMERVARTSVAGSQLGRGEVTLTCLDQPTRGWRGPVRLELGLATVNGTGAGTWRPNPTTFAVRASIDLDAAGVTAVATAGGGGPGGSRVPMLRLTAIGSASGRFFPGATLEIASNAAGSAAAADDTQLAREGYLRGALHVQIPALEIRGERLLHIAADGSVYDAADPSGTLTDMPLADGDLLLGPDALLRAGPGPAWPPLPPQSEPRMLNRVPAAPGRGPAVMHGARPLRRTAAGLSDVALTATCALSFAVRAEHPGGPTFRPFQRLTWTGRDPRAGTWTALDHNGQPVSEAEIPDHYAEVADLRDADPDRIALAVRFECSEAGAILCPGEVAWSADDGRTVLIHLPQLDVEPTPAGGSWQTEAVFGFASEAVRVGEDGSTWAAESTAGRRVALGNVAPIAEAVAVRRRRVRWRRLCAWDREDWTASPPQTLALTARGFLDVDVRHGLFAFCSDEKPQTWPAGSGPAKAPNVTIDVEEGATMHLGARAAAREPELDVRLARPTRLVSRSGTLHPDAPADWHTIPLYDSPAAALQAISAHWQALTMTDARDVSEIVQFEDSATYPAEILAWPAAPTDPAVRDATRMSLTIQAAERERPTILVDATAGWTVPATTPAYAALTLRGIGLGGAGWPGMTLPPAQKVTLEFCSILHAENRITFADLPVGTQVTVTRCETAGLVLEGTGVLRIADSIVDARTTPVEPGAAGAAPTAGSIGADAAVHAPLAAVELDRVSVGGTVFARVLDASEVIFDGLVEVEDRFQGCVRYSRAPAHSTLPRIHRVVFDTPVHVVSRNRRDPAWWRLHENCDPAIRRGAESGSEMGAFGRTQFAERTAAFEARLREFTPAGLVTGVIRLD